MHPQAFVSSSISSLHNYRPPHSGHDDPQHHHYAYCGPDGHRVGAPSEGGSNAPRAAGQLLAGGVYDRHHERHPFLLFPTAVHHDTLPPPSLPPPPAQQLSTAPSPLPLQRAYQPGPSPASLGNRHHALYPAVTAVAAGPNSGYVRPATALISRSATPIYNVTRGSSVKADGRLRRGDHVVPPRVPDHVEAMPTDTVRVIDSETTMFHIPTVYLRTTEGLTSQRTPPFLCRLYLVNRCKLGLKCHQLHADPTVVGRLRAEVLDNPPCCHRHNNSQRTSAAPTAVVVPHCQRQRNDFAHEEEGAHQQQQQPPDGNDSYDDDTKTMQIALVGLQSEHHHNRRREAPEKTSASLSSAAVPSDVVISMDQCAMTDGLHQLVQEYKNGKLQRLRTAAIHADSNRRDDHRGASSYDKTADRHHHRLEVPLRLLCKAHRSASTASTTSAAASSMCRFGGSCAFVHLCKDVLAAVAKVNEDEDVLRPVNAKAKPQDNDSDGVSRRPRPPAAGAGEGRDEKEAAADATTTEPSPSSLPSGEKWSPRLQPTVGMLSTWIDDVPLPRVAIDDEGRPHHLGDQQPPSQLQEHGAPLLPSTMFATTDASLILPFNDERATAITTTDQQQQDMRCDTTAAAPPPPPSAQGTPRSPVEHVPQRTTSGGSSSSLVHTNRAVTTTTTTAVTSHNPYNLLLGKRRIKQSNSSSSNSGSSV